MMNSPFDSSEREEPISDIEQHLRSFRPRAPRLSWDQLPLSARAADPAFPNATQSRFSAQQMTLAMAASWLLGAIVGGGCIYWSMSLREDAQSHRQITVANDVAQSSQTNPPANSTLSGNPEEPAAAIALPKADADQGLVDASLAVGMDLSLMPWSADESLSVGSLTSPKLSGRFTALRPVGSTKSNTSTGKVNVAIDSDSARVGFAPTLMSNRQQLMREYCRDSGQQAFW